MGSPAGAAADADPCRVTTPRSRAASTRGSGAGVSTVTTGAVRGAARPANLEMHHVVPLAAGGDALALDNVRMLCAGCHIETHRADPERAAWRRLLWESV